MDRLTFRNGTQLASVEIRLPVRAIIGNQLLSMSTTSLSPAGLYLRSTEYVKPLSSFQILLWLSEKEAPVFARVTASFVEQRADGCGVGVQFCCITESDQGRYTQYVAEALSSSPLSYSATFRLGKFLQRQHVVSFRGALIERVRSSLTQLAMQVHELEHGSQCLAAAHDGKVDLVVMEATKETLTLSRALGKLQNAPQVLLLSTDGSSVALSQGLATGAKSVCALPCNQLTLVSRILELLQTTEEAEQAMTPSFQNSADSHSRSSLFAALSQPLASVWSQVRLLSAMGGASRALQRSLLR